MSDSPPPAKRQRPDDQEKEITRSDVWYRDGSVILQAGNTQFRVHWSVLSSHSAFFRDLERVPQPENEPTIEGCPIVELSDSAEDVRVVLKSLYNPLFFSPQAHSLPVIASHIRLGRKYELTEILHALVDRLTYEHPRTLEAHDSLLRHGVYQLTRVKGYPGVYIDLVALAKEFGILRMLPIAYMRAILTCTQVELFDGIQREDGTRAVLSPTDQRLCNLARTQILRAQWEPGNTFGWIQSDVPSCMNKASCTLKRSSFFHSRVLKGDFMPLAPVARVMNSIKLCSFCTEDVSTKMEE